MICCTIFKILKKHEKEALTGQILHVFRIAGSTIRRKQFVVKINVTEPFLLTE